MGAGGVICTGIGEAAAGGCTGAGCGAIGAAAVGEAIGAGCGCAICGAGVGRVCAGVVVRGADVAAAAGAGVGVGDGAGVGVALGGAMLKRSGITPGMVVIVGGGICTRGVGAGVGAVCWASAGSAAMEAIRPGRYFPACTRPA